MESGKVEFLKRVQAQNEDLVFYDHPLYIKPKNLQFLSKNCTSILTQHGASQSRNIILSIITSKHTCVKIPKTPSSTF